MQAVKLNPYTCLCSFASNGASPASVAGDVFGVPYSGAERTPSPPMTTITTAMKVTPTVPSAQPFLSAVRNFTASIVPTTSIVAAMQATMMNIRCRCCANGSPFLMTEGRMAATTTATAPIIDAMMVESKNHLRLMSQLGLKVMREKNILDQWADLNRMLRVEKLIKVSNRNFWYKLGLEKDHQSITPIKVLFYREKIEKPTFLIRI